VSSPSVNWKLFIHRGRERDADQVKAQTGKIDFSKRKIVIAIRNRHWSL